MSDPADIECQQRDLAAYHVGLFAGAASRIDADSVAIAHALFLLIGEAEARRKEWLELAARVSCGSPWPL